MANEPAQLVSVEVPEQTGYWCPEEGAIAYMALVDGDVAVPCRLTEAAAWAHFSPRERFSDEGLVIPFFSDNRGAIERLTRQVMQARGSPPPSGEPLVIAAGRRAQVLDASGRGVWSGQVEVLRDGEGRRSFWSPAEGPPDATSRYPQANNQCGVVEGGLVNLRYEGNGDEEVVIAAALCDPGNPGRTLCVLQEQEWPSPA
jgi:hypothetical protein